MRREKKVIARFLFEKFVRTRQASVSEKPGVEDTFGSKAKRFVQFSWLFHALGLVPHRSYGWLCGLSFTCCSHLLSSGGDVRNNCSVGYFSCAAEIKSQLKPLSVLCSSLKHNSSKAKGSLQIHPH